MRITDFELYKDLLQTRSGLTLSPDKSYLLDSRLTPIAKKWGYDTMEALGVALRGVPDPKLINDIVEAMTTNETSFFRDNKPFEIYKDTILPYLKETRSKQRSINIWSAACSSGQESYSLAMTMADLGPELAGWNIHIKGTDISNEVLEKARIGNFTQFEVQRGLPIQSLMKHFIQDDETWTVNDEIRKMTSFEYYNLLDPMTKLGIFDVIFCRNVLIYFDEATKADVLNRIANQLSPDGFVYLGGAETVLGITDVLKPLAGYRGVYIKTEAPHPLENA